jgi:hypothetical protein
MLNRLLLSVIVAFSVACGTPTAPSDFDYAGTWTGNFYVMTCTATGYFQTQNQCANMLGAFGRYTFRFGHNGGAVSGSAEMVGVALSFSPGQVTRNAVTLNMEGADTNTDGTPYRFSPQWSLMLFGPNDLQGTNTTTFTVTPNAANSSGTLTFTARISSRSVTR